MTFEPVHAQVLELLQRQGWVSYRTLRRRFHLDAAAVAALTQALLETQRVTVDETDTRLVWQSELRPAAAPTRTWDVMSSAPSMAGAATWSLGNERWRELSPLVGREQAVALLRARWAQVQIGQGQVVALSGEAGIGQLRLVQMLTTPVAATRHAQWACRGVPTARYSAFHPDARPLVAGPGRSTGHACGGGKTLPSVVLAQMVARTEGVPLFMAELTQTVLASELVREEANGCALTGPLSPLALAGLACGP